MESAIERQAIKRLKALGFLCPKQHGIKGIPDRLCIAPDGRMFFVEFKDGRNVLSYHQEIIKADLESRGIRVLVSYTVKDVIDFLNAFNPT